MARFTMTEAVRLAIADKRRVWCWQLADELRPTLGFRPGEANVSRALSALGWQKIRNIEGRVGFERPKGGVQKD